MKIAASLMEFSDMEAIGTEIGGGLYITCTFYWDMNEGTRDFTKAVRAAMPNQQPPNMIQAGCYGSALHYLKAVTAMGIGSARDGAAVCAQMKAMTTEDEVFGRNRVRKDGLCLLPSCLIQVKATAESTGRWHPGS